MEPLPKSYIREFLKSVRFQALESNLNLEHLGRMNEVAQEKYSELDQETQTIEENLKNILDEYQISEDVLSQIQGLDSSLTELENSVEFLEELTTRIEAKIKSL